MLHPIPMLAAVAISCLTFCNASPFESSIVDKQSLVRRTAGETLYVTHCYDSNNVGPTNSQLDYYTKGSTKSQHGEQPDATATFPRASDGVFVTFEGNTVTGYFSFESYATIKINSNGQEVGNGNFAGTASNNSGQKFNCYKDNGRLLYTSSSTSNHCYSMYYCMDVRKISVLWWLMLTINSHECRIVGRDDISLKKSSTR